MNIRYCTRLPQNRHSLCTHKSSAPKDIGHTAHRNLEQTIFCTKKAVFHSLRSESLQLTN